MRNFTVRIFLILLISVVFTSCFEIIEEVTLHENGSGKILLTFNASQSKSKLASVMLLDSVQGYKVPSKAAITEEVTYLVKELKNANGISNVTYTVDYDSYIITLGCNFKQVDNINSFSQSLWDKQRMKGTFKSYDFNLASKLFKRHFAYGPKLKKDFNTLKSADKAVFNNATYTVIYRFDTEVSTYSNQQAKLSKSKKAMMMRLPITHIINGESSIENTIQLTK